MGAPIYGFFLTFLWNSVACQTNNYYPSNEYEFSFNRDLLLKAEQEFEHRESVLQPKEQTVDHYLQYLKWRELKTTKDSGFPPSRPIEEKLSYIQTTEIYEALVKFPKGGNMHSHENHDTSKRVLLDIIWNLPDFQHLYMLPPDHPTSPWTLDFFINPPVENPAWVNVKNSSNLYPKEEILKHQTLLGILSHNASRYPTDSGIRWKEINPLWGRGSTQLIANINVKKKYLQAMYEIGLSQGVIYFETRKNLGTFERIYELNTSLEYFPTNGKRYLDEGGDLDVQIAIELSQNFSRLHPEFVGHKRISYTFRQNPMSTFDYEMQNVARLHKLYPDHILGFDAVGEEDAGYSHLHYIGEFLKLYNSSTQQPTVPVYLHTAETNWPDDLMASNLPDDLVSTIMNNYETLLLNSKRIGHGYGFIKHPYLLELIRKRNIPVETCVVSNQLLGFSPDIRNHPSLHNFRYGITIMLGSDDAGTFGYDNFTVDWYEAFVAWGLDLRDLRTLAINSLNHSGLSDADKRDAIENKWKTMWDYYITEKYADACARDYLQEAARENRSTSFAGILPKEGAKSGTTKVHIFGRNFESGICKNVSCKFGDKVSQVAAYMSNQHILCESPDYGDQLERTVEVRVALDGSNFLSTGFNFTYKYDQITTTKIITTTMFNNSGRMLLSVELLALWSLFFCLVCMQK